jgi:hypothetical protein
MEVGLTPALSAEAQRLLSPAGVTPFDPTMVFHAKLALGFAKSAQRNLHAFHVFLLPTGTPRVHALATSGAGWEDRVGLG